MIINNEADLETAILKLELKQAEELNELKLYTRELSAQLNPMNIINQTIDGISSYPDLKQNLVSFAKEKLIGFVLDKYMGLRSKGKLMNVLGSALKFTLNQFVLKRK